MNSSRRLGTAHNGAQFFLMRKKTVIVLLIIGSAFVLCLPRHALQITAGHNGPIVFIRLVHPYDTLSLGFIHSVEHCPVRDHIMIDDRYRLVTYATEYWSSRTGLPYAAFGNEHFSVVGDHFRISNMHRVIPAIYQWVDTQYRNVLQFGDGTEIALASLAGNTLLEIKLVTVLLYRYLLIQGQLFFH